MSDCSSGSTAPSSNSPPLTMRKGWCWSGSSCTVNELLEDWRLALERKLLRKIAPLE